MRYYSVFGNVKVKQNLIWERLNTILTEYISNLEQRANSTVSWGLHVELSNIFAACAAFYDVCIFGNRILHSANAIFMRGYFHFEICIDWVPGVQKKLLLHIFIADTNAKTKFHCVPLIKIMLLRYNLLINSIALRAFHCWWRTSMEIIAV